MDEVSQEHVGAEQGTTPNQNPESAPTTSSDEGATTNKSANLLIVVVLAVIVVILALMYLWGQSTPELPPAPADPDVMDVSDNVDVLEEDLTIPDLESLDAEVDSLEAELDAELQQL